jgi:Lon protease-like protein
VETHHQTEQGTYNVLLVGLRRIQIVRELAPRKLFREAQVELLNDVYPCENAARRPDLQRRLLARFRRVLPGVPGGQEQLERLLSAQVSLGTLTDIVAFTLNVDQKIKEDLLAQPLPDLRALLLLECLKSGAGQSVASGQFPPEFSAN